MKSVLTKNKIPAIVMTLLVLGFIWGQSALPRVISAKESGAVLSLIRPLLIRFLPDGWITDHLIRKLAHFTEYSVLGFTLSLWFPTSLRAMRTVLLHGFAIAFIDETVQIFSGRGPGIADVWLDMLGVFCGFCLVLFIRALFIHPEK